MRGRLASGFDGPGQVLFVGVGHEAVGLADRRVDIVEILADIGSCSLPPMKFAILSMREILLFRRRAVRWCDRLVQQGLY